MIYKLFDIYIDIDEKYESTKEFLKEFKATEENTPDMKIRITDEEIDAEYKKNPEYSFEYHERVCIFRHIAEEITDFSGMFIHSAVVAVDDDGYMFLGKSGAGKTTHVKEWVKFFKNRVVIINEDKPVFRFFNDGIYAYGNPWCGIENGFTNKRVKVKSACFINQATKNQIRKLQDDEVLKRILNQVEIPKTAQRKIKFYELLDGFIKDIKFYELDCDISCEAVMTSYELMK